MLRTVFVMFIGLPLLLQPAYAESIPLMIPHSGTVASKGAPFNGEGRFRFAIINGHTDCQTLPPPTTTNCVSAWSNDGASAKGAMPGQALKIPVSNGQFSLKLGDTSRKNEDGVLAMPALGVGVFNSAATYLRVWFDDGQNGPQLLAPDRQLVAVPYAYRAEVAARVDNGKITAGKATNNGNTSGIWMWDETDSNHVIYSANSQSGIRPGGSVVGDAPDNILGTAGNEHRLRFRTSVNQGWLFENNNNVGVIDFDAGDGSAYFGGNVSASTLTTRNALIAYDNTGRYAQLFHSNGGNLHLDPIGGGNSYINWYGGTSLHIGNGLAGYGSISASDFTVASSRRLKTDISENRYGLAEILKLAPVNYLYLNDPTNRSHIGLIAEDVDTIIPEVVQKDEQGQPSGIDYSKLTVVLINAVKELKQQNEALWREINALRQTQ